MDKLAIVIDGDILTDANLRNPYNQSSFAGKYNQLTFYYLATETLKGERTDVIIVGENPTTISIGYVAVILAVTSGILVIYGIITCVRCCTKRGPGASSLVYEYEKREWIEGAANRLKQILKESPKSKFGEKGVKYTQKVCAVCLCDYDTDCEIRTLVCSHVFHTNCIESWIKSKINHVPKCPVCNTELIDQKPPETDNILDVNIETERREQQ